MPTLILHEHGFDLLTVMEREKCIKGVAVFTRLHQGIFITKPVKVFFGHFGAPFRREGCQVVETLYATVKERRFQLFKTKSRRSWEEFRKNLFAG
jgi:hypothetical protein